MNLILINLLLLSHLSFNNVKINLEESNQELPYILIKAIPIEEGKSNKIYGKIDKSDPRIKNEKINLILLDSFKLINEITTDSAGNFSFNSVVPDHYKLIIKSGLFYDEIKLTVEKNYSYEINYKPLIRIVQTEKPIIYIYPEEKKNVKISLDYDGVLTYTYPKYPENGWNIIAEPNGTLTDENGKEYYSLFWEGVDHNPIIPKKGFVVEGEKTAEFLEEKLSYLGLNRREANEFIIYWLPQMEKNNYNLIYFAGEEYEKMAKLNINPKPETLIRVMMIFQPLKTAIEFPLQDLEPLKKKRKGYTVVEWGGRKTKIVNEIIN